MYAVDNNTSFLLPNCEINKDYNTRLPDGSRKWDGKKHLFNPLPYTKYGLRPFEFYSGKIRQVIEVLFRYGYQIKLIHNRKQPQINERNWSWNPKYTLYDYQQTIVADAAKKGRGIVKLATGGGKCQSIESLVLTSDGMYEIGELYSGSGNDYEDKKLEVSNPLLSSKKDTSSHIYHDGFSKTLRINTSYNYSETATPMHRLRILSKSGKIQWKNTAQLEVDDVMILTKGQKCFGKNNIFTKEDGYWHGLIAGDGGMTIKNAVRFTNQDQHLIQAFENYCANNSLKFNNNDHSTSTTCRELSIHNKEFKTKLNNLGFDNLKSTEKTIPLSIRTSPKEVVAAYIRGLYETDGWVQYEDGKPCVCIGLSNERLIDQLHVILLNFGIVASRRVKGTTHKDSHILTIYRDYINIFIEEIGFDPQGYKFKHLNNYMTEVFDKSSNTNTDTVPNQKSTLYEIKSLLREDYGWKHFRDYVTASGVKYDTFRSWFGGYREPSRKNLRIFAEWCFEEFSKYNNRRGLKLASRLLMLTDDSLFFDRVVSKTEQFTDNYDLVVPKSHGYVSQGFINHNTVVGAGIMHRLGVAPFVFFVTSKDLLYQAKESFEDIFQMPIGVIGDGICDIQEINVCTIQTCVVAFGRMDVFEDQCKKLKTVTEDTLLDKSEKTVSADRYELIRNVVRSAKGIIFDEIHHSASDTCVMILEFCESAYFRYGLGATVERDDKMEGMIEGLFGDYICNITPSFLIKRGQLISPHIYMIPIDKYMGECESYPSEYKTYITENEFRNDAIARIAQETVKANMPTLILVKQLKHGSALKELIPGSEFIQGQVNATKRKELIQKMRDRKLLCVIATSLADEGLDVTSLECLILAGSGKSIVKAMQRIGRVIRIDKSNPSKRAIVYDFIDSSPILHSHALKRKKLYTSESEFNVYDFRYKKYIEQAALTKGLFDAQ